MSKQNTKKPSKAELARFKAIKEGDIDYSDISDMGDSNAWVHAKPFVPPPPKQHLSVRFDQDVVEWFRGQGKGYQGHMNAALRQYMKHHTRK